MTIFVDACIACPPSGKCGADSDCYADSDPGIYCYGGTCVPCAASGDNGYQCPSGQTCNRQSGKCESHDAPCDCPGDETCDDNGDCAAPPTRANLAVPMAAAFTPATASLAKARVAAAAVAAAVADGPCGTCGTPYFNNGGCACNDPCGSCPVGSCTEDSDCTYPNFCNAGCCQTPSDDGGGGDGVFGPCGEVWYCTDGSCLAGCDENCGCPDEEDPVVIDLSGKGFLMTGVPHGVLFDMLDDGKKIRTAWTATHSGVGFLVLDRNGNGTIDNSAELFSNSSPQPGGRIAKNGFKALAVFDQPANGGNGDGWITEKDSVYPKLRIWIDKNHDGVSQPSELLTLKQAGVKAISVQYTDSKWKDAYGNLFRFRGQIVWEKPVNGQTMAAIYDVLLLTAK